MPRTMGTLYWQLNDSWPVVSWSGLDYFGEWKALRYASRDAFAPLLLSVRVEGDTLELWGVSDLREAAEGTLALKLQDLRGTPLWEAPVQLSLQPGSSDRLWSMPVAELLGENDARGVVFSAHLPEEDHPILFYFLPPKALALEVPAIQMEWGEEDGEITLTLISNVLAKDVYLSLRGRVEGEGPGGGIRAPTRAFFSDNFFDLLPGRPRRLSISTDLSMNEFQDRLLIRTLAEVPREGMAADPG